MSKRRTCIQCSWLALLLLFTLSPASAMTGAARSQIEADWARQEKVTRKLEITDPRALDGALARGRLMIADMQSMGARKEAAAASAELDRVENERANGDIADLYIRTRWAIRNLALANPRIDFNEIVFVKRQWPKYNHQCSHRVGEAQIPGANICVLKGLSPDGDIRHILDEEMAKGGVGRFDLSYDARRVVFPWAKPRNPPTRYGSNRPGTRGGSCHMYDVYEINVDGTGLKQLTDVVDAEDTEPCYLPDGRVAFTSSRAGRLVQCGDWALACGIYTANRDGTDVRQVTEPKEGEFFPSMLEDGRIMYTRWDYVMKAYNVIQQLWAVNPDGRGASLVYGDHYNFSPGPKAFFEARQIPGTSKVITTGAAHHNTCAGPIMIVDLDKNRGGPDGMQNVTPEFGQRYPEAGGNNTQSDVGWYSSPYPLSEQHYLCSFSFEKNNASTHGYGLYLMDVHGNKELIIRLEGASCYSPYPLRERKKPKVIPDQVTGVDPKTPGTLIVTDIYQGLDGVKRGEVKYLRILETHSKTVHTTPQRVDLGASCGWDIRGVLGTVPVEDDGSVHFELPPFKQVFFEALDKDYLEIRRMRNFMNVMPGEKVSCVGCHEPYGTAAMTAGNKALKALKRKPSQIEPPPWGTGGFSFVDILQPILNKHCVSCHGDENRREKSKAPFDLRGTKMVRAPSPAGDGDQGPQHCVSDSFLHLLAYVSYVQMGGNKGPATPLPPNATGSRVSKLMKIIAEDKQHEKLELSIGEWRAFTAWIDCNAPYLGSWQNICISPTGKMPANVPPKTHGASGPAPAGVLSANKKARVAARRKELQAQHGTILAYIDCGLQVVSHGDKAVIKQQQGKGWIFAGPETATGVSASHKDIAFDMKNVVFEISGLDSKKDLKLHLTWWDFNNNGRRQSIWASPTMSSAPVQLLATTSLPAWAGGRKQPPAHVTAEVPRSSIGNGNIVITIKCDSGVNAVIGELWVSEG